MGARCSKNRASGTIRETIRWMVYNVSAQLCTPWRSLQQAIRGKLVSLDIRKEGQRSFWLWFLPCWRLKIVLLLPGCNVSRTSWTRISQNALRERLTTCLIFDHYSETVLLLCFSFYDGGADLWISEQQRWVAGFLPGKVMLQSRESVVEIKVCGFV